MPSPLEKSPAQGHIPALDGIRGLAIFMVMCVHFFMNFTPQNITERIIQAISGHGTLGIDLFFMLSGFLITGILLDTKSSPHYLRNFLIRRFLRIVPLYYLVLGLVVLVLILLPEGQQPFYTKVWEAQPWAWTYLFNYFIAQEGGWTVPYIGHFWSLAVEEQFYLFWPFIVYRLSAPKLLLVSVFFILLATALHFWLEMNGTSKISIHVLTPLRLNALCMGAFLATWLRQPSVLAQGLNFIRRWASLVFVSSLFIKSIIIISVKLLPSISDALEPFRTLTWLGLFASLHLAAITLPASSLLSRGLRLWPLTFLGQYSYGIYIFHHFLSWPSQHFRFIDWLTQQLGHQTLAVLVNGIGGMSISIVVAWFSFHYFEKYFLRWKDILAPRA